MFPLSLVLLSVASADPNLLTNPGFESGTTAWSTFWARAADSGSATLVTGAVHSGSSALAIVHTGSQDWSESPKSQTSVATGELWSWSVWVRIGSLSGSVQLSLVSRDSAGDVLSWSAGERDVPADTGWQRVETRLGVPRGTASLQPRVIGYGPCDIRIDDADFHRLESSPSNLSETRLRNDSLRVELDPLDLSILLVDSISGDSLRMAGLPRFRFDSLRSTSDSLRAWVRSIAEGWPATLDVALHGGAVALRLAADSSSPLGEEFDFPGSIATRPGEWLAMPRGTGLAVPGTWNGTDWSLRSAPYWDWQVATAVAGATDGATGHVVSVDQPWDARLYLDDDPGPFLRSRVIQVPSKHVFGHERSALVAPLRGGGWAELGRRHRMRLDELGRTRNWSAKIAANPQVDRLRGASDIWIEGSGWSNLSWMFFDSLRRRGVEEGIVHWRPRAEQIDSLVAHGWLASVYECYSDAYPIGHAGYSSLEYPDGAVVGEDGTPVEGWLAHLGDGTDLQALEVCAARHPAMARQLVSAERSTIRRNARFIDVELSIGLQECWSKDHPVDRAHDAAARVATLSMVKDSFGLVVGSEQTRDFATGRVDWGEGPMSIATVSDAGYDWNTPESPEPRMDTLSMSPARRIPLLPLALHDVVAPTWYTGDGQSKVPARWDAKDAWNALYATMPLIMPDGRAMWDSLAGRYLRSMVPLGALHRRAGFEPMTGFDILSPDRTVQRTRFANGWTVVANLSGATGDLDGERLPPWGYRAERDGERIERSLLDGAVRTRVRLSDRWYLDPEGSTARLDGVRTSGAIHLRRESDSTLLLAFEGNTAAVDLEPSALPWPASSLRASLESNGSAVELVPVDSGMFRLTRVSGQAFYRLRGALGAFDVGIRPRTGSIRLRAHRSGALVSCRWFQEEAGTARLESFGVDGRIAQRRSVPGRAGWNLAEFPAASGPGWIRISTGTSTDVAAIPNLR